MRNNRNSNKRRVYPQGYTPIMRDFINNVLKGNVAHLDPLANLPIKKGWKPKGKIRVKVRP